MIVEIILIIALMITVAMIILPPYGDEVPLSALAGGISAELKNHNHK